VIGEAVSTFCVAKAPQPLIAEPFANQPTPSGDFFNLPSPILDGATSTCGNSGPIYATSNQPHAPLQRDATKEGLCALHGASACPVTRVAEGHALMDKVARDNSPADDARAAAIICAFLKRQTLLAWLVIRGLEIPTTRADRFLQICVKIHPEALLFADPDLSQLLSIHKLRLPLSHRNILCTDQWCGHQWAPDDTVESDVARYWRTPSTKRKKQHHVPAPVARFARKVITMLHESLPMGKWSLARYETLTPGWEKFADLKVCQEFASYTELRESAFDILLGRDTTTRRNPPVFSELHHLPPFACFQPCPRVNLKLASFASRIGYVAGSLTRNGAIAA
jgi:hypothetical protein